MVSFFGIAIQRSKVFLAQFTSDPSFPYVGKHVANLTLAQIKTLDCGSKRQSGYREWENQFFF
jgi:hypothetical protein